MSSQIFRNIIPISKLFDLLEKICIKEKNYYLYNVESYKRGILLNYIQEFLEDCKPYYFDSKKKYVERNINYNNFATIIRQICKTNNVKYTNEIKYDKSSYSIVYFIYF
jgi:hypothetical protein